MGAQNPFRGINLYKGPVDMSSFPSNAGGYCLWSKIPLELLYISWENSPNFGLGHKAEMISTIDMRSCFLKLSCLNEDKCLMIASPHNPETVIRLQLETLLVEKARLANENSVYACENHFLGEIVEYDQLTMQDVVYLDDEEVTEVKPLTSPTGVSRMLSISQPSSAPPSSPPEDSSYATSPVP